MLNSHITFNITSTCTIIYFLLYYTSFVAVVVGGGVVGVILVGVILVVCIKVKVNLFTSPASILS